MSGDRHFGRRLFGCVLLMLAAAPAFAEADHTAEMRRISGLLNSASYEDRIQGCRDLYFSGITDEGFFDVVERRLQAAYKKAAASGDDEEAQEMAWYAKALASSGNPKYAKSLEALANAPQGKLGSTYRHLEQSAFMLTEFQRWTPIINSEINHRPGQSWEVTSTINLLRTHETELQRAGIKRARLLGPTYPELYDAIETLLLERYRGSLRDGHKADIVAWYCRTLGESGRRKYLDTLTTVASAATAKSVHKHAEKAIEELGAAP
jgi:hypothetical protein